MKSHLHTGRHAYSMKSLNLVEEETMSGLKGEQNLDGFLVNLFPGSLNIGTSSRICHLNIEVVSSPIVVLLHS